MGKNYFNTLPLRLQLEELSQCRFMAPEEFNGVDALKGKKIVIVGCGAQGLHLCGVELGAHRADDPQLVGDLAAHGLDGQLEGVDVITLDNVGLRYGSVMVHDQCGVGKKAKDHTEGEARLFVFID